MHLNTPHPTTDELLTEALIHPEVRHQVDANGIPVDLFLQNDRIHIYRGSDRTPFATLRFGGPYSGAIWIDGELAGEYEKDNDGQFVVIEITAGFRKPDSRRQKDPLAYLFEVLTQKRNPV